MTFPAWRLLACSTAAFACRSGTRLVLLGRGPPAPAPSTGSRAGMFRPPSARVPPTPAPRASRRAPGTSARAPPPARYARASRRSPSPAGLATYGSWSARSRSLRASTRRSSGRASARASAHDPVRPCAVYRWSAYARHAASVSAPALRTPHTPHAISIGRSIFARSTSPPEVRTARSPRSASSSRGAPAAPFTGRSNARSSWLRLPGVLCAFAMSAPSRT